MRRRDASLTGWLCRRPPIHDASGMTDVLPQFPYHPDPVATGSVVESLEVCERCGKARGFVYAVPVYAVEDVEFLCPWCIADGSAADQFDADFTTADGAPSDVPAAVLDEIVRRTPGFAGARVRGLLVMQPAPRFGGVGALSWCGVPGLR